MDDIYSRTPINKTAAVVTSQTNCTDSLTDTQIRDNLVAKIKKVDEEIRLSPRKSKRREELGKLKHELQNQIREIRPKKRFHGVEKYVMDILKKELPKFEFDRLIDRAEKLKKLDEAT